MLKYSLSFRLLRPIPASSVWQWIHTNGCLSTLIKWSLPTKANVALKFHRTSTPSQIMPTTTCYAVRFPSLFLTTRGLSIRQTGTSAHTCFSLLSRPRKPVHADYVSVNFYVIYICPNPRDWMWKSFFVFNLT